MNLAAMMIADGERETALCPQEESAFEALRQSRRTGTPKATVAIIGGMVDDDKGEKDRGTEDRRAASETDKKSGRTDQDDSGGDEGELTPVKPKTGEPAGNLRRRAEWFKKRHGGG